MTSIHLAISLLASLAGGQPTVDVEFKKTHTTLWGESLYLLGDLPQLGGGDPTRALRMVPGRNHAWSVKVALPAGAGYRYTYLVRWNGADTLSQRSNARQVGSALSGRVSGQAVERRVKVRYLSGFQQVYLQHGSAQVALRRTGAGRGNGEWVWEGEVRTKAAELTFHMHDGGGKRDRSPLGSDYLTGFTTFTLVDGRIHSGKPAVDRLRTHSKGRVVKVSNWRSNILGNARDIHIYLPRGYDQNTTRRYPVLYAHDGQNLFGPNAMFGGWRLEDAADRLIDAGQVAELIIVGVANTSARMQEYMPEGDGGHATRYGRFLIEELKPWVDRSLRTKTGRDDTGLMGSSLGGLVSLFLGWQRSDVFGRVGSLSGSYWLRGWVDTFPAGRPRHPLKVWIDSGNRGGSRFDSLEDTIHVRDLLLRRGFVLGKDLAHHVDYGASHNERYWRGRVGKVLRFLFPAR